VTLHSHWLVDVCTPSEGDVAHLFVAIWHLCLLSDELLSGGNFPSFVKCDLSLHVQEVILFGLISKSTETC
jgi:hypothetical protein